MGESHGWLIILLLCLVPTLLLVFFFQAFGPKWPHKFRHVQVITGRVVSVAGEIPNVITPSGMVARITTAENGPGYAYAVLNGRIFTNLQQRVGEQVTVRTGIYPGMSGARWVIKVVDDKSEEPA